MLHRRGSFVLRGTKPQAESHTWLVDGAVLGVGSNIWSVYGNEAACRLATQRLPTAPFFLRLCACLSGPAHAGGSLCANQVCLLTLISSADPELQWTWDRYNCKGAEIVSDQGAAASRALIARGQ